MFLTFTCDIGVWFKLFFASLICRVSLKELPAELCDIRVDESQFEAINIAPWFIVIVGVQSLQPALGNAVTSMYGYVYYAGVRTR